MTPQLAFHDNAAMRSQTIDLSPLRKALAMLNEALTFWDAQPEAAPLKPHLRSAVIQSFEFTYELSVRLLRRVMIERAESAADAAVLLGAMEASLAN